MTSLVLRCLGAFEVALDAVAVTAFPTDKTRALLIYMALESAQPHQRNVLADLLWPEMPHSKALTNLRLTLHRLRQTLDEVQPGAGDLLLVSTRQTLQLNPALLTVDVATFQTLLAACASHFHLALPSCAARQARLTQAVDLYRGELLAGFGLADAPDFEEWLLLRREALNQQALVALASLVNICEQQGDDQQAQRFARRQLALDPYREEAHRQVMRILARRGLYEQALAQYEACRRLLKQELDVAPDAETVALYEQIRQRGQGAGRAESHRGQETRLTMDDLPPATHPLQLVDWSEVPEVTQLYGRQNERTQLERWLIHERCRLVAVLGMGGVGKTMLVAAAVRAVANQFDVVLWHSLVNAPPLDELLRGILQRVARQRLADLPAGLDAQLALLLDSLRQQRCLLVLDNLESLLQPEQPGQMRPGYAGYSQLLQIVVERSHQSCLVLTSRERPQGVARWEEDTPLVRVLALEGLDPASGQAMLIARGLDLPVDEARALVAHYSGNPLALKLVAQTVLDLFAGDIATFLAAETPIYDDIRAVLDQQFGRLSPLEQEILVWLAIEREPITVQALRENLVQPGSPRAFIEALRALQRRSLVEQSTEGFLLQNVVMEYTTDYLVEQMRRDIETSMQWGIRSSDDSAFSIAQTAFNRYAILEATAKEYVRASQVRLMVQPIVARLVEHLGKAGLVGRLNTMLTVLHSQSMPIAGYAAGNILNLLLHLEIDLRGYDFSRLPVRQAHLQGRWLPQVNFREANLAHSTFTQVFGEIRAIHFGAGGQLLIAGVRGGKLSLWRAADGQLLQEYRNFGAGIEIATFSADLTDAREGALLLASGHIDHQVHLWNVRGALGRDRLLHTLDHPETPWSLIFSQDGTLLASGSGRGVVYLWDVQSGSLRHVFRAHTTAVSALAFTPDSQRLASGDVNGTICLWQVDAPEPLYVLHSHGDEVHALVFDGTGKRLISGSHDHTVRLWDVQDHHGGGRLLQTLDAHTHEVRALALSPDGRTLASSGGDTFICLWDIGSPTDVGQLRHRLSQTGPAAFLAFSAATTGRPQRLATTGADLTVTLWDVQRGQRIETLQLYQHQLYAVDISPDGRLLASGGRDGIVRLWDRTAERIRTDHLQQQTVQTRQGYMHWIRTIAFSPPRVDAQGSTSVILASAGNDQTIRFWEVATAKHLHTLHGHSDDIESIHFGPRTGTRLVSASRDQTVRLWDVQLSPDTAARGVWLLDTLYGHTDRVLTCAFSPDERLVASGSMDRSVRLWNVSDMRNGQLLYTLTGHTNGVRCIVFSPDGLRLASSSYDQSVIVWDVQNGRALYSLPTHETTVLSMAFHPDGSWLAMGLNDYTIRLYDVQSGRPLARLSGHTGIVECVRFSPDGQWLASAGGDGTIKRWEMAAALAGRGACLQTLHAEGPYAGMQITGVTGISAAQKAVLKTLGAVEEG